MTDIKDGDIFNWQYKNHLEYCEKHRGSGTAYWCLDQQCFATERSGLIYLIDTYWTNYGAEYLGSETSYVDPDKVDLEFICNLNDIEFIENWEVEDYDTVYNLSRQKHCYKKYAIDKGAQPSKAAILKKLEGQLQRAHEDLRSAEWTITRINKQIEELNNE